METPSHGNQFLFSPPGDLYSAASWFSMDLMSKCSLLWGLFVGSLEKTWVPLPIKFPQEKSGESMTHSTPLAATTEEVSEGIESAAAAKSLQSCPTLCDPIAGSPPGSPVPGILQARTLEWAAITFSNMWKWSCSVVSDSVRPHGLQPTRLLHPWDIPGKSAGVGCHRPLQIESAVFLHKEPEWPHIMGYLSLILTMPEVEDCPPILSLSLRCTISFLSSPPVPSSCMWCWWCWWCWWSMTQHSGKRKSSLGIPWLSSD